MSGIFENKIAEEFPEDQEKTHKMFQKKDFLSILNFLEERKFFPISSKVVKTAIDRGELCELRYLAQENLEKEKRVEKLYTECAQLLGRQVGALH